jgi:hypothetical protein
MADDLIKFIGMIGADHDLKELLQFAQVLGRPSGLFPLSALCASSAQMEIRMTTGLL